MLRPQDNPLGLPMTAHHCWPLRITGSYSPPLSPTFEKPSVSGLLTTAELDPGGLVLTPIPSPHPHPPMGRPEELRTRESPKVEQGSQLPKQDSSPSTAGHTCPWPSPVPAPSAGFSHLSGVSAYHSLTRRRPSVGQPLLSPSSAKYLG